MSKIEKFELFKVPPRWLFLKLTTDDGLVGWGEPVCEGKAETVAAAVKELGSQLIVPVNVSRRLLSRRPDFNECSVWN